MAVVAAKDQVRRLGRYTLLGHLADGGMGSVYFAQLRGDHDFTKWVAVKVVHRKHAGDRRFEKMFLTEARIVARIDHPNVAQVFDFGNVDGVLFLAMEYLSGQTLHRVLSQAAANRKRTPYTIPARIIASAASGLHAAHELRDDNGAPAGVVHRDVSPGNIFILYDGLTKLMDFGIASSFQRSDEEKTGVNELKGKFAFMAPEQLRHEPVDRRSDIFSLGIVLWESTVGLRLFKRSSDSETVVAVLTDTIPRPRKFRSTYPEGLEAIVMKALERDPNDRYQTAADMAADLEAYIASTGRAAGPLQVRRWLHDIFPSAKEERTSTLRRAAMMLEQLDDTELRQWSTPPPSRSEVVTLAEPSEPSAKAPRRVPPSLYFAGGLGLAALGVAIGFAVHTTGAEPSPASDGETRIEASPSDPEAPLEEEVPAVESAIAESEGTPTGTSTAVPSTAVPSPETPSVESRSSAEIPPGAPMMISVAARRRAAMAPASPPPVAAGPSMETPRPAAPPPSPTSDSEWAEPRPMTEFE
ncbi:MAG: protein kinase [Myxococcota bacterium]